MGMLHHPEEDDVSFWDELPIPDANIAIYRQVYVLEQWLRRIAYATLLARHGATWEETLTGDLRSDLKRRLRQLDNRVHLDCENSGNVIWLLTLEELRGLLLAESTWPVVKDLMGIPRRVLEEKLSEIREIRNVVGHSRAIGATGKLLATAAVSALVPGVECFKSQLLYSEDSEIHLGDSDKYQAEVPNRFADLTASNDWSVFQPMLSESKYFYGLTRLPCDPWGFLGIKRFLAHIAPLQKDLLAVLVNKSGDEFTLVLPKNASPRANDRVLKTFLDFREHPWIDSPYDQQSTVAICDPAIWFYENERPHRD
jgi:hypothetical protein